MESCRSSVDEVDDNNLLKLEPWYCSMTLMTDDV